MPLRPTFLPEPEIVQQISPAVKRHPLRVVLDDLQELGLLLVDRPQHAKHQQVNVAGNGGHWRAQLVRRHRDKVRLHPIEFGLRRDVAKDGNGTDELATLDQRVRGKLAGEGVPVLTPEYDVFHARGPARGEHL